MMFKIIFLFLILLLLTGLVFLAVRILRARRAHPSGSDEERIRQLNRELSEAGFAYDEKQDIFYSLQEGWQREMGYCRLYDEGASAFNMVMDCEPIRFDYGGKRWLIQLWKGQYGITTGAEVGIYNTQEADIRSSRFTGAFYHCASDEEMLPIRFTLRRRGRVVLRRSGLHWWLTGFKLGMYSRPDQLAMDVRIRFPSAEMCSAFLEALQGLGYRRREYSVRDNTVRIRYHTPHSPQPQSRGSLQEKAASQMNQANCQLYRTATRGYHTSLDKLDYLKRLVPRLFSFCMRSLYAKAFYDGFGWLLELAGVRRPAPEAPRPPRPGCPPSFCALPCFCKCICPGSCGFSPGSCESNRCSCGSSPGSCKSNRCSCGSDHCSCRQNTGR